MQIKMFSVNCFLLPLLILISSCNTNTTKVWVNKNHRKFQVTNIAILPFEDKNESPFRDYYKDTSSVVYGAMEASAMRLGYNIVDRRNLDKVMAEMKLSMVGLTVDQSKEVGKLLGADTIITGSITAYVTGNPEHKATGKIEYTRFGMTFKAIDVETGVVVFNANIYRYIGNAFTYTTPVMNVVIESIEDSMIELSEKLNE
ncbi:MAG: hypothetical protein H7A24_04495 [Leptospiraceae bacterium]|nr:hypothetical protein [Leptospiraceae bacterium]MCP5511115.1 hypothetical protein [Leptospiraceae bacterium]